MKRQMTKKILLGLTTTPGSDWREKIREIDMFGIKEIALFPTCLEYAERQELYRLLEKSVLEKIFFTHLREDMLLEEIDYLKKRYKCNLFNIHSYNTRIILPNVLEQFTDQIYVENAGKTDELEKVADKFAGLCIDFAHWESGSIQGENFYKHFPEFIRKYKIGFAHLSAINEKQVFVSWDKEHKPHYDLHKMDSISQFDYIKKYIKYLPEILGIEIENSFKEQLTVKEYLEKIINEK